MTMTCIAVKYAIICLLVVQNRFTHELAHDTCKFKFLLNNTFGDSLNIY